MPLIILYITGTRFTGQFNENGVGPRQFKPARDVFSTINCKRYYYILSLLLLFPQQRPSTPECSDIAYSVPRAKHTAGDSKTSYPYAMTVSKSIDPIHGCRSIPILMFLSLSYHIIQTGFVAYYIMVS